MRAKRTGLRSVPGRYCRKKILRGSRAILIQDEQRMRKIDSRIQLVRFYCCESVEWRRLFRQHRPSADIAPRLTADDAPPKDERRLRRKLSDPYLCEFYFTTRCQLP